MLAVLIAEDIQVFAKDSHHLDVLFDKIPEENPVKDSFRSLVHLSIYATTVRYPKAAGRLSPEIDYGAVPGLLDAIRSAATLLVEHFGVDPSIDARGPAANITPPRTGGDGPSR